MKLNDLEISMLLKISIGIILAIIVLLGVVATHNADLIWQKTAGLYRHPFAVREAVSTFKSDILAIHRDMKDLFLARNDDEIQAIVQKMALPEVSAQKQFAIMYDRYLGPREDVDELSVAFMQWKTIREETIRLLKTGDRESAAKRTMGSGIGGSHAMHILAKINDISDFATKKATEFYHNATELHDTLNTQVFAIVGLLVFLIAGLGYFLFARIRGPLNELTIAAQQFQTGNFAARCSYVSKNEFGTLSATFNQMAEAISLRIETENNNAAIAKALIAANELKAFAETVLEKHMEITESNLGAFYIRNRENSHFSPLAAIGVRQVS
jgi:HAMP domain-containing protein